MNNLAEWIKKYASVPGWLVLIMIFIAINEYSSRSLLGTDSQLDTISLPRLERHERPGNSASSGHLTVLSWPARHQKTLLYFFAPWCHICHISMSGLTVTPDNHLRIIAIALDWQSPHEVTEMVDKTGFTGEVLLGNSNTARQFQITGYPSYYVVDQQGRVLHKDRGLSTPLGVWLRTRYW